MKRRSLFIIIVLFAISLPQVFGQKKDSDVLLKQIKTEMDVNRNYARALSMAKDAAKDFPHDADFRFLLGRLYYLNRDYINAEKKLDEVINKTPEYRDAYLAAANVQLAKGYNNKALQYLNRGQSKFNYDKDIRAKKLAVYQFYGLYQLGDLYADSLINMFYRDTMIKRAYVDYRVQTGNAFLKNGLTEAANREFAKAIQVAPENQIVLSSLLDARMKSGDKQSSLNFINSMLSRQPDNYDLLMKKTGILQELHQYPEAIETAQILQKKYPGDAKARSIETELKLEAARYYKSTDPYYQYQSVLEHAPGNKEALDNIINIAISRGMNDEALYWINKSLGSNSFNKDLLMKKMSILAQQQKFTIAAGIAERLYKNAPGKDTRQTFIDMELAAARDYNAQEMPDSALDAYTKILKAEPRQAQALNSSVNILSAQKNYTAALQLLDEAITYYPDDYRLKLKKAAIMQENEQFDEAALLFDQVQADNPDDQKAINSMVDAYLLTGKKMMEVMDYDGAAKAYNRILQIQPANKEAINNITNIDLALGGDGNQRALDRINIALEQYPDDKDLLLKKAEALNRLGQVEASGNITDNLRERYPYNTQIRSLYIDQHLTMANYYRKNGDTLNAINAYYSILSANRRDTTAWLGLTNISYERGQYAEAIAYADTSLNFYPMQADMMLKKASAQEQLKQYDSAANTAAVVARQYPDQKRYTDFAAYLKGKTFRNQLGLSYLNSHIDSTQSSNIATLQYTHFYKKMSLTGRLNFAGRSYGTGLQLELESYINHSATWYSFVNVGAANKLVFPKYKAAYSLFHNFAHGWEAELGGRFLNFDSISSVSAVGSVAKYLGDFWINAKGYVIFLSGKQYGAVNLTARQYLNNKTDFFYAIIGYGNSPDDYTRTYQFTDNINYQTYSIGAGYQKMFNYRNVVSLNANWYNQKRAEGLFRNQYDIYLTFLRKF
ncbi:tetratricopeptide repeat protein [Taibaiella lutea]|uniref:Tetratricopeptide repeat protein n=1 Tax=Taibaiella lutea TaxID=2608001 RepID=A0A5M6CB10_9BACT|nr:tetratricopeptide repeat protein [Taibaiella lutea]KAA5532181.1 tetratricopeptide repeat protein [Taibaiella lutea]